MDSSLSCASLIRSLNALTSVYPSPRRGIKPQPPWAARLLRGSCEMGKAWRKHSQTAVMHLRLHGKDTGAQLGHKQHGLEKWPLLPCPPPQPQAGLSRVSTISGSRLTPSHAPGEPSDSVRVLFTHQPLWTQPSHSWNLRGQLRPQASNSPYFYFHLLAHIHLEKKMI